MNTDTQLGLTQWLNAYVYDDMGRATETAETFEAVDSAIAHGEMDYSVEQWKELAGNQELRTFFTEETNAVIDRVAAWIRVSAGDVDGDGIVAKNQFATTGEDGSNQFIGGVRVAEGGIVARPCHQGFTGGPRVARSRHLGAAGPGGGPHVISPDEGGGPHVNGLLIGGDGIDVKAPAESAVAVSGNGSGPHVVENRFLEGGEGLDTVRVKGFLLGGTGNDLTQLTQEEMDRVLAHVGLKIDGGEGNDLFKIDPNGERISSLIIRIKDNALSFFVTQNDLTGVNSLDVNGQGGNDIVCIDSDLPEELTKDTQGIIGVLIGARFRVDPNGERFVSGGEGNDILFRIDPNGERVVLGQDGNDLLFKTLRSIRSQLPASEVAKLDGVIVRLFANRISGFSIDPNGERVLLGDEGRDLVFKVDPNGERVVLGNDANDVFKVDPNGERILLGQDGNDLLFKIDPNGERIVLEGNDPLKAMSNYDGIRSSLAESDAKKLDGVMSALVGDRGVNAAINGETVILKDSGVAASM